MRISSKSVLLIFAIATALLAAQCKEELVVPDELIGIWGTTYPGYNKRDIEITKDTLILEQGEGYFDFVTYPIVGIEKTLEAGETLYVIYYVIPEGLRYEFPIYYSPKNGGTFKFKNRPQIRWTRKKKKS